MSNTVKVKKVGGVFVVVVLFFFSFLRIPVLIFSQGFGMGEVMLEATAEKQSSLSKSLWRNDLARDSLGSSDKGSMLLNYNNNKKKDHDNISTISNIIRKKYSENVLIHLLEIV